MHMPDANMFVCLMTLGVCCEDNEPEMGYVSKF